MEKVLEVKELQFAYENRIILRDISFSLEKGDFLGIIGSNGSGKSTLLKLLVRTLLPVSGQIRLLGDPIESFHGWHRIGYLSQKVSAFNTAFPASVEEVVGAHLFSRVGLFRRVGKRYHEQINQALEIVGMENYKNCLIGSLSGGQQQRVFLARLLVNQPELLFLDEPTVGIDPQSRQTIYQLLRTLNQESKVTIVLVTHDLDNIGHYVNKFALIKDKSLSIRDKSEEAWDNARNLSV